MSSREKKISIIVPLHNEEGNVEKLHKEIFDSAKQNNFSVELILVNDASTDDTLEIAKRLHPVKIINFRGWFGQTAAMDAGIKAASGEIIVTMDGDLQNDPRDIPRLLEKMDDGFDVVSGWRKNRQDAFSKKILSLGADKLRKILVNDQINDSGCTLKAFKKECFKGVDLYGEMHRFIPALLKVKGYRIAEVVVNHRERTAGQTKYDWKRLLKGLLDLTSVWFWRKFSNRPLHLFGGLGFLMSSAGTVLLLWMVFEKVFFRTPISNRIWPMMGVLLIILGFQFFVSGLLADILIKTYYQTKKEKNYSIKEVIENE
ncbi:MAG: glycosyltransferase family 2 protein [Patescibacteria group bacterium]|nr:glycosyltransferase family 2 protein [Patescibacteria group bacterium]